MDRDEKYVKMREETEVNNGKIASHSQKKKIISPTLNVKAVTQ